MPVMILLSLLRVSGGIRYRARLIGQNDLKRFIDRIVFEWHILFRHLLNSFLSSVGVKGHTSSQAASERDGAAFDDVSRETWLIVFWLSSPQSTNCASRSGRHRHPYVSAWSRASAPGRMTTGH